MPLASPSRRKLFSWALAGLAVATVAGCSSAPKPTVVAATVQAADNLNPDATGRPSPLVVRVYELKALSAFNDADFFSLWDRDQQTLGADLNGREELVLRPGDSHNMVRVTKPDTGFIGVVAAFRDLERAKWRANVAVVPNKTLPVTIKLNDRAVEISAAPIK